MSYENIMYQTDGRLAFITLNRPEKLNALSNELRGEVFHALKEAEADRAIGAIIIRGAGRAFCAGYDLGGGTASHYENEDHSPYVHPQSKLPDTNTTHPAHYDWSRHVLMANWTIWELAKPVIAQIHSYCLAGGTELASFCDFRIVSDDAQIGYPPVRAMGSMDIMWAPWHLPMTKAREFAYVGDSFSGADMAEMGWATYSVPSEQLDEFTEQFAR
ncbi:MAG: enoyl-CoA hydratase-related protein, partial [Dehalococcoidia bacterium]|nr:enoyl-CoA hydratase-related protein [Dehalococcoidia bacterium]